jgi:acetyltransferase-like isoleucine patch superfamily enzyme
MFKFFKLPEFFLYLRQKNKQRRLANKPIKSLTQFKKKYPRYEIGHHCYGIPSIKYPHKDAILKIASYCSIARNVQIFMGGMHRTDWVTTYPFPAFEQKAQHIQNFATSHGNVVIGSDVWLCQNATILSGVTIGHGAVVANGAIVTKDVAPYEIVGGNPAKHIRWRFDEPTREALLASTWWDWSEEEVLSVVDLICSDDTAKFLEYVNTRQTV